LLSALTALRPAGKSWHAGLRQPGECWASLVCFLDITERKRAEEAPHGAQEKLYQAFLSVPAAITVSELDSGQFVECNDAATTLFGYPAGGADRQERTPSWHLAESEARAAFIGTLKQGKIRDVQ
jgi:PAS domain-containing protein